MIELTNHDQIDYGFFKLFLKAEKKVGNKIELRLKESLENDFCDFFDVNQSKRKIVKQFLKVSVYMQSKNKFSIKSTVKEIVKTSND